MAKRDYEVGYGKPSRHSQFKPGMSGNAKGRPKGARGLKTDLLAELDARHTIQINKRAVSGTRQRLMMVTLATRAASGDLKAANILLPLILQIVGSEDRGGERRSLSPQDQALLDELLGEAGGEAASDDLGSGPDASSGNDGGDDA